MFIENLRHAKNKWRVLVGILMGLIVISLLATFSYAGRSVGVSGSSDSDSSVLATAEATAENAAKAAKDADGDMTVQGDAAAAFLSLAAYQELFLEDPADSYKEALKYAQAMVTACGDTQEPDYDCAYGYELSAYAGLGDSASLSAAFNESLKFVDIDQTYLDSYFGLMSGLEAYDQFVADMDGVNEKLEKQAAKEPAKDKKEKAKAKESEDGVMAEEEMSASDLIEYVQQLVNQANLSVSSAE